MPFLILKRWMRVIAITLGVLTAAQVHAQRTPLIDSLRLVLQTHTEPDTLRANTQLSLAKELYRTGEIKEALALTDSAKKLSLRLGYRKGVGEAWATAGYALYRKSEYHAALSHYDSAYKIFTQLNRHADIAKIHLYKGQVYDFLSQLDTALKHYNLALEFLNKTTLQKSKASVLNSIGANYFTRSSYELAIQYFYKSLEISERLNENPLIASSFNNLGAAYEKIGQYNDALISYQRALPIVIKTGNKLSTALAKSNIGGVYIALQRFEEGEAHIQEALTIQKELNDRRGMIYSYSNLGTLYLKTGAYQKSESFFKEAMRLSKEIGDLEISLSPTMGLADLCLTQGRHREAQHYLASTRNLARQIGTPYWLEENYLLSSKLDSARHDYKSAYQWHKAYTSLKDSLFNRSKSEQIALMKELYESEKKDYEIQHLREAKKVEEIKRVSGEKVLMISLSAGVLIIGGLIYVLRHKTKTTQLLKQQKDEIAKSNEELTMLLATIQNQSRALTLQNVKLEDLHREKDGFIGIIAHDLRSPLNKTIGLAGLIPLCGEVNAEQKDILDRIRKVCEEGNQMIHDLLVLNQVESAEAQINPTTIVLPDFIRDILDTYTPQLNEKQLQLYFTCSPQESFDVVTDAYYFTRIVDNLISNAIKFSPRGGSIQALLTLGEDDIHFSVKDEGQGIREEEMIYLFKKFKKLSARPTAGESSTGLGLSIVKLLTEKLHGSISVESTWGKGATFTLNLPRA